MERQRRKIAVDKDDVLIDFNSQLCVFHNEVYGTNLTLEDIFVFDLFKVWDCSPEESFARLRKFYRSSHFNSIIPVEGALDALAVLKQKYELCILTARPADTIEITHQSVEKHFPDLFFGGVHFAHAIGENARSKAEACLELGIDTIIDDSIKNIRGCRDAGIETYLFRRPWNRTHPDHELLAEGITPVKNWQEILKHLGE